MDHEKKNRKPVFSRKYLVNPRDQERFFFLRLLLLHVKGARSFADLRTFEDITYATYREAA